MAAEDRELEQYRALMETPDKFEEGFSARSIIGAFFIGLIMMPGAIYLGLLAGQSLGPAAEWVTIILFTEAARRSLTVLRKQEVYILYYIAGSLTSMAGGLALSGGPFAGLIWNQYLRQSEAARGFGIESQIPDWVVPPVGDPALIERTFFSSAWLIPIVLLLVGVVLGKMNWFGLGYVLFRVTSDLERLPFPMAPIAAQGSIALAEVTQKAEGWRWHLFSTGAVIGLAYGLVYVGIPSFTGSFLTRPLTLIPIPWYDMTLKTERLFPAVPTGITTDLGAIIWGFIAPYWVIIGGAIAALTTFILNPMLFHRGMMPTYSRGMETISTNFATGIDFWISIGIGISVAVAVIGMISVTRTLLASRGSGRRGSLAPVAGRGDFPLWVGAALFIVSTVGYILLCKLWLVPKFPVAFLLFFGFIYTPLDSYVNARMIGLTGQYTGIPMVREATFILSGYKGVDIWFAPIPMANYGAQAQSFRAIELTGTRITSIIKAEVLTLPILLACSLIFWQYMWKLAPIPSNAYPYAQKMWHMNALSQCLVLTATSSDNRLFLEALKPTWIAVGAGFGLGSYALLSAFGMPVMLIWGFIKNVGRLPHSVPLELLGALVGRYYFERRYGMVRWKQYATVIAAGYAAGMGLTGMGFSAMAMVMKSVRQLPY